MASRFLPKVKNRTHDMNSLTSKAVFVHKRRQTTTVESLGVECDENETPIALRGEKPSSWWIAERTGFAGEAQDEASGEVSEGAIGICSAALAITTEHLLGIVAPDDFSAAALWFALPLAEIQVKTEGSKGLLRKRPEIVTLTIGDAEVNVAGVARFWRNSGNAQPWQEKAFIEALSAH
jgi:hypothetical protein